MRRTRPILLFLAGLWCVLCATRASAQADDAGYQAAVFLLEQSSRAYPDGRHNELLRGLRLLGDPRLRPLFQAMTTSPNEPQRIHGRLGLAEVSDQRQIDLSTLAEYQDTRELTDVISAAFDDKLISRESMQTLIQWQDVRLGIKMSVALHLIAEGGRVDPEQFRAALALPLNDETKADQLLEFALGALLLAELGEAQGLAALESLSRYTGPSAEAVIGSVLVTALRYDEMRTPGQLAIKIADDPQRSDRLRLTAVEFAVRKGIGDAAGCWRRGYEREDDLASRLRYSFIALDALPGTIPGADPGVDLGVFEVLMKEEDPLLQAIGQTGKAFQESAADLPGALEPLLKTGYPHTWEWVVRFCRRTNHPQSAALLEALIRHYAVGESHSRAMIAVGVSGAVRAYAQMFPDLAADRLPKLLDELSTKAPDALASESIRLMFYTGLTNVLGVDLKPLVKALPPADASNLTIQSLSLLLRARCGDELKQADWERISDLVQGVGSVPLQHRVQLAWLYLKHLGRADEAMMAAVKN